MIRSEDVAVVFREEEGRGTKTEVKVELTMTKAAPSLPTHFPGF